MRFESLDEPAIFLERAGPLLADEARHNLMLGICHTLIRSPGVYDEFGLYLLSEGDRPSAAAIMTPPYNLIIADVASAPVAAALCDALMGAGVSLPGVIGNRPTIDHFAAAWMGRTGDTLRLSMEQGVFALTAVAELASAPGRGRLADSRDNALVAEWMTAFQVEALPDEPIESDRLHRAIDRRLRGETPGAYWIWEVDGAAVSLTGHGNPTGRGIRIGPVYTPPGLRGNGYATALVAAQSQWLIDNCYEFCFHYTDMANPTSNAIYERIGYRQIAESAVYVSDDNPISRAT